MIRSPDVRYLKVTLLIGSLVSLLVVGLAQAPFFEEVDAALGALLGVPASYAPARFVQLPVVVLLAFGIAWTTVDISRLSLKVLVAAAALAQVLAASWVASLFHHFFSPWPGALAILFSFGAGLFYARSGAGRRKRVVETMLADRISPRTFRTLVDSDVSLRFEGEIREASVLVCEIFNHEELAEGLPVPEHVALHNSFLRNASEFLVERGGYLDECGGETLRVLFGTPLPDKQHAAAACRAALALVERLDEVNRECEKVWKHTFDFRIGINSGEIVVATYASKRLQTLSVAGEPVEFARRLCAANTIYGSRVLLGYRTFHLAESAIEVRPIELIQRYEDEWSREELYELLGLHNALSPEDLERRDAFWKGIVYYREQRWDEALGHFHSARLDGGADAPVEFYIRRIEQLREGVPALHWSAPRI
ncbi:MAG: adenylate/guanylate cyclase domain-containing protein [Verrucomicrobiota bacterium]|nr:adenylate/guanylate cyclase domain-containing protein [Verrucomicrobiota bacterium]